MDFLVHFLTSGATALFQLILGIVLGLGILFLLGAGVLAIANKLEKEGFIHRKKHEIEMPPCAVCGQCNYETKYYLGNLTRVCECSERYAYDPPYFMHVHADGTTSPYRVWNAKVELWEVDDLLKPKTREYPRGAIE